MSIQVSDLAQSNLLQDLNTADSIAVVGGGRRSRKYCAPVDTTCVDTIPADPCCDLFGLAGDISTGAIANFSGIFGDGGSFGGTAIGFGSAIGSGFTAGSSKASVSAGGATASGTAFTNGISGVIKGTFNRT